MKPKIVHLFNSIEYSGAERMIFTLRNFYNEDFQPYALSTGEEEGAFYGEFGQYFKTVHLPVTKGKNFRLVKNFFDMIRFYRKEKIDILHIHPSKHFLFHVLAAKMGGVTKVVRQVHNNFIFQGLVHQKEKLGRKIAVHLGVSIIAISKTVRETEKTRYDIEPTLINNFFDEDKMYPSKDGEEKAAFRKRLGIPANAFCVVSVGSCIARKQHDHIIRMIAAGKDAIPELFYVHLGDGPLCAAEQQQVAEGKLGDRVLFAGNQSNIRDYLVASDVYIMTSILEGLSIATIEAMGTGIPVVLYDTLGSRELGEDGAPGILVEPTVEALTARIIELHSNGGEREMKAESCYEYAINVYSKRKAIEYWKKTYAL